MTQDAGRRIAISGGSMLADPDTLGNHLARLANGGSRMRADDIFEPLFWQSHGALAPTSAGRGSSWFVAASSGDRARCQWVLRHYRRGGWAARVSSDRYVFTGEAAVRSFAEFRLLARLRELGLPVPRPIAARYVRSGLTYRADLITERIPGAASLADRLATVELSQAAWRAIGATLARLHEAGLDHADLNAHNILLAEEGLISVIDLDRGRMRKQGPWVTDNLNRLRRSLHKIAPGLPTGRCTATTWAWLLAGYADR